MKPYFIIYVSIATEAFADDELLDLLTVSRRNNALHGITGMLLYKKRKFMQLLEGEEGAVRQTYEKILRDPRHRDAVVLLEGKDHERDFEDWTMAFHDLDNEAAQSTPGFSPFLNTQLSALDFASDPSRAHQLLRIFRRI